MNSTKTVELVLPAEKKMMLVLRLTTAGVMTRFGVGVDRLDDIKMATEEAAACMIGGDGASSLKIRYTKEEKRVCVRLTADSGCPCEVVSDTETEVIRSILETLADEVEIGKCSGRVREIALSVSTAI